MKKGPFSDRLLRVSSLALFLAGCGSALAQDADSGSRGEVELADDTIVVTAQRRSERLIDVPASISVLNADTLNAASIKNTFDLVQVTPGLQVSNTGAFTSFAIRGVSAETSGPGAENNVAVYVDGVYFPSKSAGVFDFPDIESIEVLKGPQGTLYGRNATGGAILFKTLDPTFEPSGRFSATYGRFDERQLSGHVSSGLGSDVVAASLSGHYRKSDGYLTSAISGRRADNGVEDWLVRGKVLIEPSDAVRITLSAYYSDRKDRDTLAFETFRGNSAGVLFDPNVILSGYGEDASNNPNVYRNKTLGLSGKAEIETSVGQLSIISGYTDLDSSSIVDGDNSSVTGIDFLTIQPQKSFSQEVYLASRKFGMFSFIAGANYFRDVGRLNPVRIFAGGAPILDIYAKVKTDALAAYLDANADLTDRLTITAGLRWTTEKKKHFGAFGDPSMPFVGQERWSNVSPRAAIRYALGEDANIYASYSRGFKSGQFNPTAVFAKETVRPEIVDAFEAGIKARIAGQLTLNVSAFHYNYEDIQVTTFEAGAQRLQNAAEAKLYGIDADLTYRPLPDLVFTGGLSLLHTNYSSFPGAVILVPTATCPPGFQFCGNENANADLTGNRLPRAPNITANASASYTLRAGGQAVNFFANVYYSGNFYWEISNRIRQDNYAVLNGRISWNINEGPYSLELWGQNLTDSKYYISQGIGINADGLLSARPFSWGITARAEF